MAFGTTVRNYIASVGGGASGILRIERKGIWRESSGEYALLRRGYGAPEGELPSISDVRPAKRSRVAKFMPSFYAKFGNSIITATLGTGSRIPASTSGNCDRKESGVCDSAGYCTHRGLFVASDIKTGYAKTPTKEL